MTIDAISDLITRIRNASMVGKEKVLVNKTNLVESVVKVLVAEKYVSSYKATKNEAGFDMLELELTYVNDSPAINNIKTISKPGVRIYKRSNELKRVLSGLGIAIISTSHGIMTNTDAVKNKLGGEVLIELW